MEAIFLFREILASLDAKGLVNDVTAEVADELMSQLVGHLRTNHGWAFARQ
jgi:hypothetical protein